MKRVIKHLKHWHKHDKVSFFTSVLLGLGFFLLFIFTIYQFFLETKHPEQAVPEDASCQLLSEQQQAFLDGTDVS